MRYRETIWLLEDEEGVQEVFQFVLGPSYNLKFFKSLNEFQTYFSLQSDCPDLLITDLNLPDGCFTDFLSGLQKDRFLFSFPFMVVSTFEDPDVLRFCFDRGASDYLVKPFNKTELNIKVERLLKQKKIPNNCSHRIDQLVRNGIVTSYQGLDLSSLELTNKESKILSLFLKNETGCVTRQQISEQVWKGAVVSSQTLNVHLSYLRKKLSKVNASIILIEDGVWELRCSQ